MVFGGILKMFIPVDVEYILNKFNQNNYQAFLVGGCVRDSLLNRSISDYDIATNALPEETMKLFPKHIATGLQHGTITVIINKEPYEITTFRTESTYINNRKPEKVEFVKDIKEDLSRRDFTINALAFSPTTGLIDYFDGTKDLKNKIIRCVGNPDTRFQEDALRMLRAIRFSCKLNFNIENDTFDAIKRNSNLITNISNERIKDELCKILISPNPSIGINNLKDSGLLKYILPEVFNLSFEIPLCTNHNRDIFLHTMKVLDASPNNLIIRLAALLHDIGKINLVEGFEDNLNFLGHAEYSYEMCIPLLKRLKFDNNTISIVSTIVRYHMEVYKNPEKLEIKLLMQKVGIKNMSLLFELQRADIIAIDKKSDVFLNHINKAENLFNEIISNKEPVFIKDLSITGNDIIKELGINGGKLVGKYLNKCLNLVLHNPDLNKKEHLIDYIKKGL